MSFVPEMEQKSLSHDHGDNAGESVQGRSERQKKYVPPLNCIFLANQLEKQEAHHRIFIMKQEESARFQLFPVMSLNFVMSWVKLENEEEDARMDIEDSWVDGWNYIWKKIHGNNQIFLCPNLHELLEIRCQHHMHGLTYERHRCNLGRG